jgi:hypothetical protein
MCKRQHNLIEFTFQSLIQKLESKRQEFQNKIADYYHVQRQKLEPDKLRSIRFYDKVKQMHSDFERIESLVDATPYEDFFKLLNTKSKEIDEVQ